MHTTHIQQADIKRIIYSFSFLPLLLMAVLAGIFFWQIHYLLSTSNWLTHLETVIEETNHIQKLLIDMETGLRGYQLTGDKLFLEPYEQARQNLFSAFNSLNALVADNPSEVHTLDDIRLTHKQWEDYALRIMKLREDGGDYQAFSVNVEGKQIMDRLRIQMGSLLATEQNLYDTQSGAAQRITRIVGNTVIGLAILLGGFFVLFFRRNLVSVSKTYEKALQAAEEHSRALAESEERYRRLVEVSPNGILINKENQIVYANGEALRLFEAPETGSILGKSLYELFHADFHATIKERIHLMLETNRSAPTIEEKIICSNGKIKPVEVSAAPFTDKEGKAIQLVLHDISQRQQMEKSLRENEERFRLLIAGVKDYAIFMLDTGGIVVSWNAGAERTTGYHEEEILGQHFAIFYAGEDGEMNPPEEVLKVTSVAGKYEEDSWRRRKDGSRFRANMVITALADDNQILSGFVVILHDVTERVLLEEQLYQAQKMEAIGRLAGGIAHDFNNLLTAIIGYSQLAQTRLPEENPVALYIEEVRKAAERAASLTSQLLAFSRKQVLQPKLLNLNMIITDLEKILRRLIGDHVELSLRLASEPLVVKADPTQLEQIIINLVVNARDAMPRGGKLIIETASVDLDDDYARGHISVKPGIYVMLAISDTGMGMDKATQERIFEPFFTTKELGKGTGLGLSTVYGIVKQSGGNIWVYSEIHQGTIFRIYLPLATEPMIPAKPVHQQSAAPSAGGEIILLVEDDDSLREMVSNILENSDYQVLKAANAQEALQISREQRDIQLLLTDVVMPKMNGRELAKRLIETHPSIRALFMSGYTDDTLAHYDILDSEIHYVQKPFSPETLRRKIREVLDETLD